MAASLQHVMSPRLTNRWPLLLFPLVLSAEPAPARDGDAWTRYHRIRDRQIFADVHAHPSRFHRDDVERVGERELSIYRREGFGVVVCSVSSDAAFQGGYTNRDGSEVPRLGGNDSHDLAPGEAFDFTLDRMMRVLKAVDDGDAAWASSPGAVGEAVKKGQVALLPALEGGDGLEGEIGNLRLLHRRGLRLLQLVHLRDNDLGCNQTEPYLEGGLTPFGREVVRECNRLGIIVDLAHANTRTITDALAISSHPVIFSHTGANAVREADRHLDDAEIRAIAAAGGLIGIWPFPTWMPAVSDMIDHIDHVRSLVGADHLAIGSDFGGLSSYTREFGDDARFSAIAIAMLERGYPEDEVGRIMGGNFFRLWEEVGAAGSEGNRGR